MDYGRGVSILKCMIKSLGEEEAHSARPEPSASRAESNRPPSAEDRFIKGANFLAECFEQDKG